MIEKRQALLVELLDIFCVMVDEIKNAFFSGKLQYLLHARNLGQNVLDKLKVTPEGQNDGYSSGVDGIRNITDLLLNICNDVETKVQKRLLFSTKAVLETSYLLRELRSLFEITTDFVKFGDHFAFDLFKEKQASFEGLHEAFIANHETRMLKGICLSDSAVIYLDVLAGISNITMYLTKLVFMLPVISADSEAVNQ